MVKVIGVAEGDFQTPDAFDGSGCEGDWDKQSLDGTIWTIDHTFSGSAFAGVVRFDGASATYNGFTTALTVLDGKKLFWYRAETARVTQRTFYACTRPAAGQIDGAVVSCNMMNGCSTGTFHAVKLERRAGEAEASGLTELAEFPFPQAITANVRVDAARNLAVLARYDDGLYTMGLDAGPPYKITQLGHGVTEESVAMTTSEIYNDVKLLEAGGKHWALMASSAHGVVVWDVSDPVHPTLVAHARDKHNVHTLAMVGTTGYLGDLDIQGLAIVDFSDPSAPKDLGEFVVPEAAMDGSVFVHDLYVEPGRAYLDYWGAGMVIADVSDPAAPKELGRLTYGRMTNHSVWVTTINGRKIALTGDEDFTAHLREVDVTDPANPRVIGEFGQDRPQVSAHNVLIDGDIAYVAYYQDGIRVLRLSDTAPPVQIGWFNSWSPTRDRGTNFYEGGIGVDKIGSTVYLADIERGLIVLSVP
ncbi:MAG: hypothetical protein JWN44_5386 [Myxococcales bacterium]|nr:hypothetical protein [Myxococcales bacterium]